MTESAPVVVAVGNDDYEPALAYGVEHARRVGCGVRLVHVVQIVPTSPEAVMVATLDLESMGSELMEVATRHAKSLGGDEVPVSSEVRMGPVVPTLTECAKDARLIVVQHRDRSLLERIVLRSVTSGVAAHATVPVVAVPATWHPGEGTEQVVVAGVDVPERSAGVLRAAAEEARARGAALRIVHSWVIPDPYGAMVLAQADLDAWRQETVADVTRVVDSLGEVAEGLELDVVVGHARAADALLEASRDALLLVMGRHDPLVPIGSHLGAVARGVLRDTRCPVLLTDPRAAT